MSTFSHNPSPSSAHEDLYEVDSLTNDSTKDSIKPWGDVMEQKSDRTLRVYFQNVNGLPSYDNWAEWNHIVTYLKEKNIDIAGFAETNIKWDLQSSAAASRILRAHIKPATLISASCDEPCTFKHQRGGVMMTTQGRLTGRISQQGRDQVGLGRWVYTTYIGKQDMTLVVITAYRVSQSAITKGDNTAYNQQYRALRRQGMDNPKPKQLFCSQLLPHIREWKTKGSEILLMLDANDDICERDMSYFLDHSDLYDILGMHHTVHSPPTFIRGSKTIDLMLGTKNVVMATQRCGMNAYNDIITSDHRALWLDLDIPQLFKGSVPPTQCQYRPPLRTSQHKKIQAIRKKSIQQFRSKNIIQRLQNLKSLSTEQAPEWTADELNRIDEDMDNIMLNAIPKHTESHPYWWSPEIHHSHLCLTYWKIKQSAIRLDMNFLPQLTQIITMLPSDYDIYQGSKQRTIAGQIRKAKQLRKSLRANSYSTRQRFLLEQSQQSEDTDPKRSKRLRQLRNAEALLLTFNKLRRHLKTGKSNQLNFIERTRQDGTTEKIVIPEDMNKVLLQHHKDHFSQAAGTPFTTPYFESLFGDNTDSDAAKAFREGALVIPPTGDSVLDEFISQLSPHSSDPPKIDDEITLQQLKTGFTKWKEKTSTSPKGRVLTLYKLWLSKEAQSDEGLPGDTFLRAILDIINLSKKIKIPLDRWKTVHNIFIRKDKDNSNVKRLRAIHKIDAELNLIRRELIAKRLLRHAEAFHFIPENNYGGRNGKTANDVVLQKHLTLQSVHLKRQQFALTDCDATACYDRIIPILLYLCYSKAGLPHWTCVWLCRALTTMKYHMSTGSGVSEEFSSTTASRKIYGVGQGATDAPTGWLFVSVIISRTYEKFAKGCQLRDPSGNNLVKWTHIMFVDDTYLVHMTHGSMALQQVIQNDLSTWDRSLRVTGGKLEPGKTSYYELQWAFDEDGNANIIETDEDSSPIIVQSDGTQKTIEKTSPTQHPKEFKSLGVRVPGDLSDTYEYNNCIRKIKIFTKSLRTCPLTPREAWLAYKQYFIPSFTYGSLSHSFTDKQCDTIHRTLLPSVLPKLGYNRSMPREIVFGPRTSGGLGMKDHGAIIACHKLTNIIKHVRANNTIGKLFRIAVAWFQHHCGVGQPILESPTEITFVQSHWMTHLVQVLIKIQGKLVMTDPWRILPQRVSDQHIMESLIKSNRFSANQLRLLNNCRLFLSVTTISDIASSDGTQIIPHFLDGSIRNAGSHLDWPEQGKPGPPAWSLWKSAIMLVFTSGKHLIKPLGRWLRYYNNYKWWYDSESNTCVNSESNTRWSIIQKRRYCILQEQVGTAIITKYLTPITDMHKKGDLAVFTIFQWSSSPSKDSTRILRGVSNNNVRAMPLVCPAQTQAKMAQTLWIVSDGGVHNGLGYYGWVIATDVSILWEGCGQVPGDPEQMDSLRAESHGLLEATRFLVSLYQQDHLDHTTILKQYCDNKRVIQRMELYLQGKEWFPNELLRAHMDVQLQIEKEISLLSNSIQSLHVKGHQDKSHPGPLPWEAILNIRADKLATQERHRLETHRIRTKPKRHRSGLIDLFIQQRQITKNIVFEIDKAWTTIPLRNYLRSKYKWTSATCDDVDWFTLNRCIIAKPEAIQRWFVKYHHQWLPLNGHKGTTSSSNQCPMCLSSVETANHFQECTANPEQYSKYDNRLQQIWDRQQVDPVLRTLVRRSLCNKSNGIQQLKYLPGFPVQEYKPLLQSQQDIGWNQLKYGRWSLQWDRYQCRYLKTKGSRSLGKEPIWQQQTLKVIMDIEHKRWLARNNAKHPTGCDRSSLEIRKQALTRIYDMYKSKNEVLNQDKHIFTTPLSEWDKRPTHEIQRWILTNRDHIKRCRDLARIQLTVCSSDIRRFITITKGHNKSAPRLEAPTYTRQLTQVGLSRWFNKNTSSITKVRPNKHHPLKARDINNGKPSTRAPAQYRRLSKRWEPVSNRTLPNGKPAIQSKERCRVGESDKGCSNGKNTMVLVREKAPGGVTRTSRQIFQQRFPSEKTQSSILALLKKHIGQTATTRPSNQNMSPVQVQNAKDHFEGDRNGMPLVTDISGQDERDNNSDQKAEVTQTTNGSKNGRWLPTLQMNKKLMTSTKRDGTQYQTINPSQEEIAQHEPLKRLNPSPIDTANVNDSVTENIYQETYQRVLHHRPESDFTRGVTMRNNNLHKRNAQSLAKISLKAIQKGPQFDPIKSKTESPSQNGIDMREQLEQRTNCTEASAKFPHNAIDNNNRESYHSATKNRVDRESATGVSTCLNNQKSSREHAVVKKSLRGNYQGRRPKLPNTKSKRAPPTYCESNQNQISHQSIDTKHQSERLHSVTISLKRSVQVKTEVITNKVLDLYHCRHTSRTEMTTPRGEDTNRLRNHLDTDYKHLAITQPADGTGHGRHPSSLPSNMTKMSLTECDNTQNSIEAYSQKGKSSREQVNLKRQRESSRGMNDNFVNDGGPYHRFIPYGTEMIIPRREYRKTSSNLVPIWKSARGKAKIGKTFPTYVSTPKGKNLKHLIQARKESSGNKIEQKTLSLNEENPHTMETSVHPKYNIITSTCSEKHKISTTEEPTYVRKKLSPNGEKIIVNSSECIGNSTTYGSEKVRTVTPKMTNYVAHQATEIRPKQSKPGREKFNIQEIHRSTVPKENTTKTNILPNTNKMIPETRTYASNTRMKKLNEMNNPGIVQVEKLSNVPTEDPVETSQNTTDNKYKYSTTSKTYTLRDERVPLGPANKNLRPTPKKSGITQYFNRLWTKIKPQEKKNGEIREIKK